MPFYNNNEDKLNYIKATGSSIISNQYRLNINSLLTNAGDLDNLLDESDEFIVIRKFDDSSVSPSITAQETWSAWTLPKSELSGSSMYTFADGYITFSSTASDYTWTTAMSGRESNVTLPVLSAADTIYVIKKVYLKNKFVNWQAGAKITSSNLNIESDQMITALQELMTYFKKFEELNPSVGKPNGLAPLNSSGIISSDYIDGSSINLQTSDGLSGAGTAASPLALVLNDDSLVKGSGGLKVDTIDSFTSSSTTKPLSANRGRVLNETIVGLGSGVVYKGAFDLTTTTLSSSGIGTPQAGWTIGHNGGTGTALADWDSISVANGNLVRYNGVAWQVASDNTPLFQDGSVSLGAGATWDTTAGTVTVTTQSSGDNSTKASSTAFVQQEISAINLSELNDVDANTDDTTGNMIYWDGNSWAPIPLESTTGTILTTNSDLGDLNNVNTSSVSLNQVLQWNGSTWVPATVSSTANEVYVNGATADGSTDDITEVQAAFDDLNLGYNTTSSNATLSTLNFRSRRHKISDEITISPKKEITYLDGSLELNIPANYNKYIIKPGTTTKLQTTLPSQIVSGTLEIPVTDSTGFAEGDLIRIVSTESRTVVDTRAPSNLWKYASFHMAYIDKIINNVLYIDEPVTTAFIENSLVERAGEGTNGANQIKGVKFDRMKFKDQLGQTIYTDALAIGTTPITLTTGSATATLDITGSSNGVQTGGYALVQDADLGGGGSGVWVNSTHSINRWVNLTGNTANSIEFAMGENSLKTGSTGGTNTYVTVSLHHGVHIKNGSDILFKDCVFENFNGWAVLIENCKNVTFDNCVFKDCHGTNYVEPGLDYLSACIKIKACDGVTIKNCKFYNCVSGIVFDAQTDTVDGNTQYVGSKNIKIVDCSGSCTTFVMGRRSYIYDKIEIIRCNIRPYNPSLTRSIVRGFLEDTPIISGSFAHSAIRLTAAPNINNPLQHFACDSVSIRDCNFDSMIDAGSMAFDATAYWAEGDGLEKGIFSSDTFSDNNLTYPWFECIRVAISSDIFSNTEDYEGTWTGQKIRKSSTVKSLTITGCSIGGILYDVFIDWFKNQTSTTLLTGTWVESTPANVEISNNRMAGMRNVSMINRTLVADDVLSNVRISNNHFTSYSVYKYIPSRDLSSIAVRNIQLAVQGNASGDTTIRGLYYDVHISDNTCLVRNGYGNCQCIVLGSSDSLRKSFYHCVIATNHFVGATNAIFVYTDANTTSQSNVSRAHFVANTAHSIELDFLRNSTKFLADNTNKLNTNPDN